MSQNAIPRRIRPYLFTSFQKSRRPPPSARPLSTAPSYAPSNTEAVAVRDERKVTHDYERRVTQLQHAVSPEEWYPRLLQSKSKQTSIEAFRQTHENLQNNQTNKMGRVTVMGRIRSVRSAGSKLLFVDIQQERHTVQCYIDWSNIQSHTFSSTSASEFFAAFKSIARKGDVYTFRGHPYRTTRGELSVLCTELPILLAPSLHQLPDTLDPETRARKRHVEMLIDSSAVKVMRARHIVEKSLTAFLDAEGFTSVHTPILTSGSGGAIARPFETEATEFAGETLNLRIAPELWLKRLVVGGLDKVYELGPAFRNEGVDATHNPEFYTCEFYEAYATLPDLMSKTERMLAHISREPELRPAAKEQASAPVQIQHFRTSKSFRRVEFIPTLEAQLGRKIPDLSSPAPDITEQLMNILATESIPPPSNPTLPRLLDALAAHYLEPLSQHEPIFITHHPAVLSPLAKHFVCPRTGQTVAARAELFVRGWEVANMYEEENSPFEQRRKFLEQASHKDDEAMHLDEAYLEALEWGLPPTGGWGCGVDRLVMLFAGRERIGDVLPFGGLRNVVGLGKRRTRD